MIIAIFFIVGLIVGSFLNVLVARLKTAEDIFFDRSHCPQCKKQIRWYDNVPLLSFVLLGARCRDCKEKISWQYPLVELFTGLIFALVGFQFFRAGSPETWFPTFYYLVMASFLMVILAYDWLYMEIPGAVLWTGVALAAAANLVFDWLQIGGEGGLGGVGLLLGSQTYSGVLAAILAFTFFFLMVIYSRERWMGMGDAYLAIFLGLILGWSKILLALFLAFAIGAIYGIIAIALKKKRLKSQVPFAPFLVLGTLITIFFYAAITGWYFSALGF
jgi:prepilin signal peptidase PulO-like enzyme (type II secretory pathway)